MVALYCTKDWCWVDKHRWELRWIPYLKFSCSESKGESFSIIFRVFAPEQKIKRLKRREERAKMSYNRRLNSFAGKKSHEEGDFGSIGWFSKAGETIPNYQQRLAEPVLSGVHRSAQGGFFGRSAGTTAEGFQHFSDFYQHRSAESRGEFCFLCWCTVRSNLVFGLRVWAQRHFPPGTIYPTHQSYISRHLWNCEPSQGVDFWIENPPSWGCKSRRGFSHQKLTPGLTAIT